jgi:dienelactone hydrolase
MKAILASALLGGLLLSTPAHAWSLQAASAACATDIAPAATVERTQFKSRGRDIEALLFRPTGPANGAGIVALHGAGGLYEDLPRFEAQIGQWASRGYVVMVPNYYDASRQSPRDNPLVMDRWQQAGDDAIEAMTRVQGVDAGRIGLWGFSLGGALALNSALDGGKARAVVVAGTAGRPGRGAPQTPILMLAGDHDPDLSLAAVRENERLLRARGVPITVETYAADRHLLPPGGWCEAFDKSRAFLDRYLLTPAA